MQILREKRLADDRIGVTQSQTQNHAQAEMNFRFHVSSVFAKMFVASFEGFRFHIEISLQCHFIQILLQKSYDACHVCKVALAEFLLNITRKLANWKFEPLT